MSGQRPAPRGQSPGPPKAWPRLALACIKLINI